MAAHDAGVQVACPGCGHIVLQKAMIPVLGDGGQGLRYLCSDCARALVVLAGGPGVVSEGEEAAVADGGTPDGRAAPDV